MGVPSFYRWLAERYPKAVVDTADAVGVEFDNLYIDMNGIIYSSFHPDDRAAPTTFDEALRSLFDSIDRLFLVARPRKLLYLAIDGVAPRAKANCQRARLFTAAKDAAEAAAEEERLRREFARQGRRLPPKKECHRNRGGIMAPGTQFMDSLSSAVQYYIHLRLNSDSRWKKIKVIFSDSNVPGEGEHKIMSFIRCQRNRANYDPNARHCLYGMDADLIILALATHEVHFSILRDAVSAPADAMVEKKNYQFVNIWTVREYLEYEFKMSDPPFDIDFERIVDDFVLMTFFLGNDFLPRLPSLEMREGAMDLMMFVYKREFEVMGGYMTDSSKLKLSRVEHFMQKVGAYEDKIFLKRAQLHQLHYERFKQKQGVVRATSSMGMLDIRDGQNVADHIEVEMQRNMVELRSKLEDTLRDKSDLFSTDNQEEDLVKLGEPGWKQRYYEDKFCAVTPKHLGEIQTDVVMRYAEGLCWMMHYYYEGLCSWQWFYPYHYAPFASDFKDLGQLMISFKLGSPLKPLDRLTGIVPPASSRVLPVHYRRMVTDPNSPIIDFYPSDFEVDTSGKRFAWQGVIKLPFIDEFRLLAEIRKVEHTLTDDELRRNGVTPDMIFVNVSHPLAGYMLSIDTQFRQLSNDKHVELKVKLDPIAEAGINGYISSCGRKSFTAVFISPVRGMEDIIDNQVVCSTYELPDLLKIYGREHITRSPAGVVFPKKTVAISDLCPVPVLWHEDNRRKPSESKLYSRSGYFRQRF